MKWPREVMESEHGQVAVVDVGAWGIVEWEVWWWWRWWWWSINSRKEEGKRVSFFLSPVVVIVETRKKGNGDSFFFFFSFERNERLKKTKSPTPRKGEK